MKICNVILCLNAGGAENAATIISNYLCKKHKLSFLLFIKRKNWPVFYKRNYIGQQFHAFNKKRC